ncbi:related to transcription factor spt3 [Cephalotrichum gorgonifer]|uniref:Related to transcription factor spt3 n=1 Tax=Cephalotrichum gorgonifer TaxID=2041049 RepID=A0AAE8SSR1_9PEZI|nr:related to transcription factor spt3 [Cephalotrichum gorgonifer]
MAAGCNPKSPPTSDAANIEHDPEPLDMLFASHPTSKESSPETPGNPPSPRPSPGGFGPLTASGSFKQTSLLYDEEGRAASDRPRIPLATPSHRASHPPQHRTGANRRLPVAERVLRLHEILPTPPLFQPGGEFHFRFRPRLTWLLEQMMYVSGETAEPSVETTGIIEDILRMCTELATRRGSRSISINDLIFQIRHDQAKVSRLRTFLSWKDVRKTAKDSDDKGADADLGGAEDPVGGVVPGGGGPADDTVKKAKTNKTSLPWEPSSYYNEVVPEREDEEDEDEEEMNHITLQRLQKADERTKAMTKEEYVTWSEYRQASFTFRKSKRFREWAGFGIVTDSRPSDDIVDILGFLTFEMVQTITEVALDVKEQEDVLHRAQSGDNAGGTKKRKLNQGLFDPPSEGKTPVEPRHVIEAFRRLQQRPKRSRVMLNGTHLPHRSQLNIPRFDTFE